MNILLIEILACLLAASLLSLFIGWMIRNAMASKELKASNAAWESKQSELELRYKQDTEQLEEQVAKLDVEAQHLAKRNDSITESLRDNEISVHKARTDAIELNRQQADTQERLQRIIAQKDDELKLFRERAANQSIGTAAMVGSTSTAIPDTGITDAKIATLSAKREAWENERQKLINNMGDDQATVAIDPADLPGEPFDETVKINPEQMADLDTKYAARADELDAESDKTLTLDDDQTVLLDDESLRNIRKQRRDKDQDKED